MRSDAQRAIPEAESFFEPLCRVRPRTLERRNDLDVIAFKGFNRFVYAVFIGIKKVHPADDRMIVRCRSNATAFKY